MRIKCDKEEHEAVHFWYASWPDHSFPERTPATARHLLQLVRASEACRRRAVVGRNERLSQHSDEQVREEGGANYRRDKCPINTSACQSNLMTVALILF
ncbi:unnamed protein product [Protopolystoma xenopodis]|uniref:Tyrosine-protein phosphatase domain-containing protein n=1 Tax=Protopolystoma xenopodis TaxID=117903 RepID=A0A3S5CGQ7_9PLAT|nr:unnamed protein product [Protopolystoma xenopodis]